MNRIVGAAAAAWTQPPLTMLYGAEFGFCTRSAHLLRRLDRIGRLRLVALQVAAETMSDAPPFMARLPAIRRPVEPTYALAAPNRFRWSRAVGNRACRIDQEQP